MWIRGFYNINMNTLYLRQKFQNMLERKLCNCFEQLSQIHSKNVKHGIEHYVDSVYRVCIHYRHSWIYSMFNEYLAI